MWFLTESHFKIVRPPLCSWHQSESLSGLIFLFWVSVGPTRKTRQQSNWQFTNCLEERDFEQMTTNIGILYAVGNNFSPQLTIWDSYLKVKPLFVQLHCQSFDSLSRKACFSIRPLSLRTNGTNTTRRLRETCGDLEPQSKMAGDDISSGLRCDLTWAVDRHCRRHLSGWEATLPPIVVVWNPSHHAWGILMTGARWSRGNLDVWREKERELVNEKDKQRERKREIW